MASAASFIFLEVSRAIRAPMLLSGTVCRLSKFAAHVFGNPSASVKITSVGMLRMVDVIGATVTAFNTPMAESRVRISTGRLLSGALNAYQHTSPRFTLRPSAVHRARRRIRRVRRAFVRSLLCGVLPLPGFSAVEFLPRGHP
jgi:hypothetical protein